MPPETQKLAFPSEKEFYAWKEEEEGATFTHYIKTTAGHQLAATNELPGIQEVKSEDCSSTGQYPTILHGYPQYLALCLCSVIYVFQNLRNYYMLYVALQVSSTTFPVAEMATTGKTNGHKGRQRRQDTLAPPQAHAKLTTTALHAFMQQYIQAQVQLM